MLTSGLFGGILTIWLTGVTASTEYNLKVVIVPEPGVSPVIIDQVWIWQAEAPRGSMEMSRPLGELGVTTKFEDPIPASNLAPYALTKADEQDVWYCAAFDVEKIATMETVLAKTISGIMIFEQPRMERTVECASDGTERQVIKLQYSPQDVLYSTVFTSDNDDEEEGEEDEV